MPDTLEALFERLRTVEPPAPYAPAHDIRRRGRRQSYRHRMALGGAALAVGAIGAGTAIVAAGRRAGADTAGATASPSVSPSPSVRADPAAGRSAGPAVRPRRDPAGGRWSRAEVIQNPDMWGNGDLCDYDSADYPSLPHQDRGGDDRAGGRPAGR